MLAASLTTARETFHYAADKIVTGLQPEGRAAATAATFRQIGDIVGDLPLTPGDLVAGLELLAEPRTDDEPTTVVGRRTTCDEIATLLRPVAAGDAQRLGAVFRAVEITFEGSADPSQAAIAATATREAGELESFAG